MLHEILNDVETATEHVREYYRQDIDRGMPRTGASFDQWKGGGDRPDIANEITGDDCVAVSFLAVEVPRAAAIGLMDREKANVDRLLSLIPTDINMWELDEAGYEKHLGLQSPAQELWDVITRRNGEKWKVGRTKGSKIMARKRPNLIPIVDSVIEDLIGYGHYWHDWHRALNDGSGLPQRLEKIRQDSGILELDYKPSILRIMDIVLWAEGKAAIKRRNAISAAASTVLLP
ncbi:DUF6308 family protein [Arthrobacter sp. N1]|uniref:DUF6308 family protein n=1 Tax=Arthrobacter sp. N1 TaxID=619291 RepID=UPI003BAE7121